MADFIQQTNEGRWTAVRTRPRCEKKVAEYAQGRNIPCYLPLQRRCGRYQRRFVETFIPMFSGYVFVRLEPRSLTGLLECNRIVRVLPVTEGQEKKLVQELNDIRVIELAGLEEEIIVSPGIVPGKPVLITEGPLRGCCGIVEKRDHRARVIVNLELLGNYVAVTLDLREVAVQVDTDG